MTPTQTASPNLEQTVTEYIATLEQRLAAARAFVATLEGEDWDALTAVQPAKPRRLERKAPRRRGVSQHYIDGVRDYMQKHGTSRQVQITRDLKLNSGTVSLALRALEEPDEGPALVRPMGVEQKSKVWQWIGPSARATVVDVGDGVREGRKLEPSK